MTSLLIILHVVALAFLLMPFWLEARGPERPAYSMDIPIFRRSKLSYCIALPLFFVCVVVDVFKFHLFNNVALVCLTIWVAIELYGLVVLGRTFLRPSR